MEALGKDGRYELRDQIGQGPRSTVHHATDLRRRAPVIIKRLDPTRATPAALTKYSDSVAALRKSSATGLLLPQEIVAGDPTPHLVYAPLEGQSLETAVQSGPLQWTRAVQIVASLATTLAASNQPHLALKPTNVWLAPDGGVLLLDHGIAALGPGAPLHRGNAWLEYRAPEQLDGAVGDARADVFSLAVLLFELSTGVHPFAGATAFQSAQKLAQTPPDLGELTRGMSPAGLREITKLMTQCLASEPDDRPTDVAAFSTLLAYVRPIVGVPNPPRTLRPEPAPEPARPVDPSTLQSLPQLRQLLVQRAADAGPTPVLTTPVEPAPPPATPTPAAALEPPPAQAPADVPRAPSHQQSAPMPSRKPLAPPDEPRAPSRPHAAPTSRPIAPEPDEPPTLVGDFNRPDEPEPAPASKPAPAAKPAPAPVREEHTVIDRARPADAPAPADRTVVDYAMPSATPRAPARPEQTEILRRPDADDDDEEDRPTVALIRGNPGEATLMLPEQMLDEAAKLNKKPAKKKKRPAGPSAKVQWTLVAVNVLVVLLVIAALAYTFL